MQHPTDTKKKLISWLTVLDVMTNIYSNMRHGSRNAISGELLPLLHDDGRNNSMATVFKIGLIYLGLVSRNSKGTSETYNWVGRTMPDAEYAKMLYNFVFTDCLENQKVVVAGKDKTSDLYVMRHTYMNKYRHRTCQDHAVARYARLIELLSEACSNTDFTFAQFAKDHGVTGPMFTAMNDMNLIDCETGNWVPQQCTWNQLAQQLLLRSGHIAEKLDETKRLEDEKQQKITDKRLADKAALGVAIASNPVVASNAGVKLGTRVGRVLATIIDKHMYTGITVQKIAAYLDRKDHLGISVALTDLKKVGKLQRTCPGVYALSVDPASFKIEKKPVTVATAPVKAQFVSYRNITPETVGNDMIKVLKMQREKLDNKIRLAEEIKLLEEQETELKRLKIQKEKELTILMSS